ncbi:hypothetical protein HALLA_16520 [Halostagnicola larsenii XH-48]|uniref:Uncharacterized protein n=1 Tax=Halostagnicola larsenii XH-48 TaxID=797299 RepID=W0JQU2_9EURY|nr:hypothetical protein HALLA_16520 [Halostagnicola larsenii XH-48]
MVDHLLLSAVSATTDSARRRTSVFDDDRANAALRSPTRQGNARTSVRVSAPTLQIAGTLPRPTYVPS